MDVVKLPKKVRMVCYLWGRCGTYYLQKKD